MNANITVLFVDLTLIQIFSAAFSNSVINTVGRYCDRYFSQGVRRSGIYTVNAMGRQIEVYCEFQLDGHNWIVSSHLLNNHRFIFNLCCRM